MKALNVLIAPLDWGLGHATRCIPIIHACLNRNAKVTLAGNGPSLQLLQNEFPDLTSLEFPPFEINYGHHFAISMIKQLPKLIKLISQEKEMIQTWQKEYAFDLIISDNRYGAFHPDINSVFISHQLSPKFPKSFNIASLPIQKQLNKWMNTFNEIWVPDFEGAQNLSGDLSKNKKLKPPIKHLGPLSRFDTKIPVEKSNQLIAVISGPEPARTTFEEKLVAQFIQLKKPATLVRGLPNVIQVPHFADHLTVFNHLNSHDLNTLMRQASLIISRAGYSTIMDLYLLNKPAILIPTPGQPEQEYLARHLSPYPFWVFCHEDAINIDSQLSLSPQDVIKGTPNLQLEISRIFQLAENARHSK